MNYHLGIEIRGTGATVPDQILNNEHFASYLDTSPEWIMSRTGIRDRRKAAEGQSTLDLALEASRLALDDAGMEASELDLIIVCTASPETPLPSTACWLQAELGIGSMSGPPAFDLAAACSGFVYGLNVAGHMIESGPYHNVLLVGAETLTRITDYQDRATCILFGDGAGAAIVSKTDDPDKGVIHHTMGADGTRAKCIWIPAGGAREPACHRTVDERLHFMRIKGREIYKFAVLKMEALVLDALKETGTKVEDLRMVIPHQSNRRIMDSARERIDLPLEKMVINIDRFGNTSSASVAMALDEARRDGRVKSGDLVLFVAFGAGLTWASTMMRM